MFFPDVISSNPRWKSIFPNLKVSNPTTPNYIEIDKDADFLDCDLDFLQTYFSTLDFESSPTYIWQGENGARIKYGTLNEETVYQPLPIYNKSFRFPICGKYLNEDWAAYADVLSIKQASKYSHRWQVVDRSKPTKNFRFPDVSKIDSWQLDYTLEFGQLKLVTKKSKGVLKLSPAKLNRQTALDVFFLCNGKTNADANFERVKSFFPNVKKIEGVKGFYEAHKACAEASTTYQFWVLDADCYLLQDPNSFQPEHYDHSYVHLFYSLNPCNGLTYGHGGIKIFNKTHFAKNKMKNDLTLSIGNLKIHEKVLSVHHFNADPYSAFRTAFREANKLSFTVKEGNAFSDEAKHRLDVWISKAEGKHSDYCLKGAVAGYTCVDFNQVNDESFLQQEFLKVENDIE